MVAERRTRTHRKQEASDLTTGKLEKETDLLCLQKAERQERIVYVEVSKLTIILLYGGKQSVLG